MYSGYHPLLRCVICRDVLPSARGPFALDTFQGAEVASVDVVQLINIYFCRLCFGVESTKSWARPMSLSVSPMIPSKSFLVLLTLDLIFRPLMHFEIIYMM